MIKLIGRDAIEYAETNGVLLNKYADPIENARADLSVSEARKVASEDPSLIWVAAILGRARTRQLVAQAGYYDAEWERDPDTADGLVLAVSSDSREDCAALVKACRAVGLDISESHDETGRWIWVGLL